MAMIPIESISIAVMLKTNNLLMCQVDWVGGLNHESNVGGKLTEKAAQRLRERIPLMNDLPLQYRLLLLRCCFYPCLSYLSRTLLPNVGLSGTAQFDDIISQTVLEWADDVSVSSQARDIISHGDSVAWAW